MPVFAGDHPGHFTEALDSVLCQLPPAASLIVVADGPLPPELEDVMPLENSRVEILRLEANRGLAVALNTGIERAMSRGYSLIARMDADDRMLTGRLDAQCKFLDDNPEVDVVGTAIIEIDSEGQYRGKTVKYPLHHEACLDFFRYRDPLAHPSVMFRTTYFAKAGLYDPAYRKNQDTELWLRGFLNGCRFANLPEPGLEFRMSDAFFRSRRGGWKRGRELVKLRMRVIRELGFGWKARLFAGGMFVITIMPSGLRKLAYKIFR